jgi:hypothetical protein
MKPAETELSCSALKMHMLASTSQLWEPSGIRIEETDEGLTLGEKLLWPNKFKILGKNKNPDYIHMAPALCEWLGQRGYKFEPHGRKCMPTLLGTTEREDNNGRGDTEF